MANYIATDTDLESVADAIRTKGGTSADLVFPGGFVDAIDAISGGGVLGVTQDEDGYLVLSPLSGGAGVGLNYDYQQVVASNNTPKVDRAFENFLFVAQVDAESMPETLVNTTAYFFLFLYIGGKTFMQASPYALTAVRNSSSGKLVASTANASNTVVGDTSITFSSYSSQNIYHGTWNVLQIEIPSTIALYSFRDLEVTT